MRIVFFATIIALSITSFVPAIFAQNSTLGNVTAPSRIGWSILCNNISQMNILFQSCDNLVSQNGTLTSAGQTAMGCIKSALSLGLEALHHGVPLSNVIFGLNLLTQPSGCGGQVNMNAIESANQFQFLIRVMGLQ
ncbi:MAG: hypothetical protein WCF23_09725 [Candidatus Nitrosopolaris sp.]